MKVVYNRKKFSKDYNKYYKRIAKKFLNNLLTKN